MEKSLTIYPFDGRFYEPLDVTVLPMTKVRSVMWNLALEGFHLVRCNGDPIPDEADIFAEVPESGNLLALWDGHHTYEDELPDDD